MYVRVVMLSTMHLFMPSDCPSHLPATCPTVFFSPLLLPFTMTVEATTLVGWLPLSRGGAPPGRPSPSPRPGVSPPHGPIASMAVHKNSWAELWDPELASPAPPAPSARARPVLELPSPTHPSQSDKESCLAEFACENPLWPSSLASWPPDQPAKLQSKATDLHESSRMGRGRMADLDCNLSRSVPEFFFSLFLRGEIGMNCE